MADRIRWIALAISVPGMAFCVASSARFFGTILGNGLSFGPRPFFREHYLAVTQAYSQAFAVGFFLCLFLVITVAALGGALSSVGGPRGR